MYVWTEMVKALCTYRDTGPSPARRCEECQPRGSLTPEC